VAHWLEELARTMTTFKLAGRTSLPLSKVNHHVNDYLDARNAHFAVLVQQYWLMTIFKGLVALGLLAIGGWLVMEQRINIGQFVGAEIIVLTIMSSVEKLILTMETIYDVLTGLEKIGQVTDMDLENHKGIDLLTQCDDCGLNLSLKNVDFAYPDSHLILNNLTLDIKGDEKWLVTGPSGSGKSTLLQVIAGIFQIKAGEISYNNLPQGNLNLRSVRSAIGECLESEQLFEGTLLENITTGRSRATFDNVKWAVENVGLTDFLKSCAEGYESRIEPQGKKLPRSIVQKILLARAIADMPKLLLIENILDAISAEEGIRITNFLTHPDRPWTLVAVSSNHYLASKVDKIAVLQSGSIKAIGPYSELDPSLITQIAASA
ncbi:MAG: ATP-binding cassette domain-containing protein, partial [Bacteroidota bacterium]